MQKQNIVPYKSSLFVPDSSERIDAWVQLRPVELQIDLITATHMGYNLAVQDNHEIINRLENKLEFASTPEADFSTDFIQMTQEEHIRIHKIIDDMKAGQVKNHLIDWINRVESHNVGKFSEGPY